MLAKRLAYCAALAALLIVGGCASSDPEPFIANYDNIYVAVRQGASLKGVVAEAAARRRWTATDTGPSTLRLTLIQRANKVVVDVKIIDASHYSIHMVECTVPGRKYMQWISNLQASIAALAR